MDLRRYLHAVRTYWWVILLPCIAGLVLGLYSTSSIPSKYRASSTFFIGLASAPESVSAAVQGDTFAQRRVNSYLGLLLTDRLAERVIDSADLDLTPAQVRGMIGGSADLDTVLITATVTSTSRDLAMRVAEAVSTEFVDLVEDLETQDNGSSQVNLQLVSGPSVSQVPSGRMFGVASRGLLGLMLGCGLALLLELRDNTIRSDYELQADSGVPVLGTIPIDRSIRKHPLITDSVVQPARAEALRQLRTNLEFIDIEEPVEVLVVTSATAGEGKSLTAANMALTIAATGRNVLLVDGDLRRPTLGAYFKLLRSVGLTDVIVGRASLSDALRTTSHKGVTVLPSGPLPPNPSELLGSLVMARTLDEARKRFDLIIIDTPPLLPVTDAALLSAYADGVVVVVRRGKTSRHQVLQALRSLHAVGARVLGTVLNMAPAQRGSAYGYHFRREVAPIDDAEPTVPDEPNGDEAVANEEISSPASRGTT